MRGEPKAPVERVIHSTAIYEKSEFLARTGLSADLFQRLREVNGLKTVRLGQRTMVHGAEYERVIRQLMEHASAALGPEYVGEQR